jgi:hypothetical protein
MDIYNLSDRLELDDNVTMVYRKSLLYLVSRSYEDDPRPAPLLGMQVVARSLGANLHNLEIHVSDGPMPQSKRSHSNSHGGFDNDPLTMNSVLTRVLGRKPVQPFTSASLKY